MRKVELRMNEEFKYKIIKKLVETNGNKKRAAIKLKIFIFPSPKRPSGVNVLKSEVSTKPKL